MSTSEWLEKNLAELKLDRNDLESTLRIVSRTRRDYEDEGTLFGAVAPPELVAEKRRRLRELLLDWEASLDDAPLGERFRVADALDFLYPPPANVDPTSRSEIGDALRRLVRELIARWPRGVFARPGSGEHRGGRLHLLGRLMPGGLPASFVELCRHLPGPWLLTEDGAVDDDRYRAFTAAFATLSTPAIEGGLWLLYDLERICTSVTAPASTLPLGGGVLDGKRVDVVLEASGEVSVLLEGTKRASYPGIAAWLHASCDEVRAGQLFGRAWQPAMLRPRGRFRDTRPSIADLVDAAPKLGRRAKRWVDAGALPHARFVVWHPINGPIDRAPTIALPAPPRVRVLYLGKELAAHVLGVVDAETIFHELRDVGTDTDRFFLVLTDAAAAIGAAASEDPDTFESLGGGDAFERVEWRGTELGVIRSNDGDAQVFVGSRDGRTTAVVVVVTQVELRGTEPAS